jgi:hypothetical protein
VNAECIACGFNPDLPVRLVGELELHISYPSGNQIGTNARGRWGHLYRKYRQEFAAALHTALAQLPEPMRPADCRRRVWLHRVYRAGKRPYDYSNLMRGEKPIVDCLVARGLLKDDSPKWFEGIYKQEPGPTDLIRISLYDILV